MIVVVRVVVVQNVIASSSEIRCRPVELDMTVVHDDHPRHKIGKGCELMRDDEDGQAFGDQAGEHLGQDVLIGRIHPGRRLVHDQHLGFASQGPSDEHPTLLPAG